MRLFQATSPNLVSYVKVESTRALNTWELHSQHITPTTPFLTPKSLRNPKWVIFWWSLFEWELWSFLDGGKIYAIINEFDFSSNTPNPTGFEVKLNLVDFFKVIQCPKFHWIWTLVRPMPHVDSRPIPSNDGTWTLPFIKRNGV